MNNTKFKTHKNTPRVSVQTQTALMKKRQKDIEHFKKREQALVQEFNTTPEQIPQKIEERIIKVSQELRNIDVHINNLEYNRQLSETFLRNPLSQFYQTKSIKNNLDHINKQIFTAKSDAHHKNRHLLQLKQKYNEYTKDKIDFKSIDDTQFIIKDLLEDTGMFADINADFFDRVDKELGLPPLPNNLSSSISKHEPEQEDSKPAAK